MPKYCRDIPIKCLSYLVPNTWRVGGLSKYVISGLITQRLQYPLITEYSLNYSRIPNMS